MQAREKKTGKAKFEAKKWPQFRNSVLRLFGVEKSVRPGRGAGDHLDSGERVRSTVEASSSGARSNRPERGAEGGIQNVAVETATTFYLP